MSGHYPFLLFAFHDEDGILQQSLRLQEEHRAKPTVVSCGEAKTVGFFLWSLFHCVELIEHEQLLLDLNLYQGWISRYRLCEAFDRSPKMHFPDVLRKRDVAFND